MSMGTASVAIAAAAYVLVYLAAPSRRALREAPPARTRALLWTGCAGLIVASVLATAAWGAAAGLSIVVAVGTATGSVMLLIAPLAAVPLVAGRPRGTGRTPSRGGDR